MKKIFECNKIEASCIDWIKNHFEIIVSTCVVFLALAIRYIMIPYSHSDFDSYVLVWYDQLANDGGLLGLRNYSGNYNYPYPTLLALLTYIPLNKIYMIKGMGIIFDFLLALTGGMICKKIYKTNFHFATAFSCILMSPLVILNCSYWGQCDSIYATFVLISIYLLLSEQYPISFFVYGIAIAFKIQALFVLPLFIILYLVNKKYSILNFLLIAIGFFTASLPGMIFSGKGFVGIYQILFSQVDESELLSANFPNIYYWFSSNAYNLYIKADIIFTTFLFAFICLYLIKKSNTLSSDDILDLAT